MHYLLKTEPSSYSFDDLTRDQETVWDGVSNPTAVKHLREMKSGDHAVIYHTGDEKRAVGTATVLSVEVEGKTPTVKLRAGKPVPEGKTLAAMKEDRLFSDSPLVRQGRLSVVPLTPAQWTWITHK